MRKRFLILLVFLAFFAQWLLMPGKLECSGDGPGHASAVWFYGHSLKTFLRVPWTNPFFFSGASFSVFYFSLFYAAAGILSTVLNYLLSIKIVIILSYALSLCFMRLLAKEHGLDERESVIAGLVYAFSNWTVFTTFFRGAYLDVVAYAFLPLPFLYIRRGLDSELVPFIASTALIALSYQNSLYFILLAIAIYALVRGQTVRLIWWAAALSILLAFFIVPFALMKGETQIKTGFAFLTGIPINLAIPQWGWFYSEYDKYIPHLAGLDSMYLGVFHIALAILGAIHFRKKLPGMALLALYGLGFLFGVLPSLYFSARILFLLNLPLSLFAAFGARKMLKLGAARKTAILAAALLVNALGLAVLANVYLERAQVRLVTVSPIIAYLPAILVLLAGSITVMLLRKGGWKAGPALAAIAGLLLLEALPNAANPTMFFPTSSQIDPSRYPTGEHEFIANSFCATPYGKAYSYHQGLWHIGSARLTAEYERLSQSGSSCPEGLAGLGVKYCFSSGKMVEMEPAPFINSTAGHETVKDEPDYLVMRFDEAGRTKVRLGYFGFYKAFSNGKEIELKQSREGFIEFDNPAGLVELKAVPPASFKYSYLASLLASLGLVALLLTRRKNGGEAKVLALAYLPILVHLAIRLF